MRSKLYISLVILALLCLVAWTGHGQRTRQSWEYKVDLFPTDFARGDAAGANERLINQRAAEGWELAAVGNTFYYFKRAR